MNSDTYATSRYVNAIVPQLRLVACLEVMLDSHPALESATRSGHAPVEARSHGHELGQKLSQIAVKWSVR